MMPYRAAPPAEPKPQAPSTSFPRKSVGLYMGIAISLAVFATPLPIALLFAIARRGQLFHEGGVGMYGLLVVSGVVATALGAGGALVVRGKAPSARFGAIAATIVPVVPAILGALLGVLGMRRAFGAVAGEDVDPDLRLRILGVGLAESDSLPAYGALIAAVACGVGACALLAGGASVDRTQHNAPAGNSWVGPAALGGLGFIVAIVLRAVLHSGFVTLLVSLPSMLIVTTLACMAAANAPLVRHWREPRESDAWISSLLAAALLAAAGFALLEVGASFAAEARGLAAIGGEALDPSQRARILAEVVEEQSAYRTLAIVDGLFGFLAIAPAALAALGRSTDGRLRFPRGAPMFVTLAGVLLAIGALGSTRSWILGGIDQAAQVTDTLELPRVPLGDRLVSRPTPSAIVLRVDSNGKSSTHERGSLIGTGAGTDALDETLTVDADRRALWKDVATAIHDVRVKHPGITAIDLRVTLLAKADRSALAPYGPLLGNETSVLHLALALDDGDLDMDPQGTIRFREFELMDAIAAVVAKRPIDRPTFGLRNTGHDLAVFPPKESW